MQASLIDWFQKLTFYAMMNLRDTYSIDAGDEAPGSGFALSTFGTIHIINRTNRTVNSSL